MIKRFIIAFLMMSASCYSQENKQEPLNIDGPVDKKLIVLDSTLLCDEDPFFPGGEKAMKDFIATNFQYPLSAKEAGISGKVYVSFVIGIDGNISDVRVLRGINGAPDCDKEALRLVNIMPKWIPAKKNGVPVKVWMNLPVIFKMM